MRKVGQSPQTGIPILTHPQKPASKRRGEEEPGALAVSAPAPDPEVTYPDPAGVPSNFTVHQTIFVSIVFVLSMLRNFRTINTKMH